MSLLINTNISALKAHNKLKQAGEARQKSAARLSSGNKINSAADDAAGLSISEKMRAQIRGLDQAARNIEDGVSLLQVGDGALAEINDMLVRVRELAVQSANDTNSDEDRQKLDDECQQLLGAIEQLSKGTEFNKKPILYSEMETILVNETVEILVPQTQIVDYTAYQLAFQYDMNATEVRDIVLGGGSEPGCSASTGTTSELYFNGSASPYGPVDLETEIYDYYTAKYAAATGQSTFDDFVAAMYSNQPATTGDLEIFRDVLETSLNKAFEKAGPLQQGTPPYTVPSVILEYNSDGKMAINYDFGNLTVNDITVSNYITPRQTYLMGLLVIAPPNVTSTNTALPAQKEVTVYVPTYQQQWVTKDIYPDKNLWLQTGANMGDGAKFIWKPVSLEQMGMQGAKLTPLEEAVKALEKADPALSYVNEVRGKFGAYINRLELQKNSVKIAMENLSTAESRIRDTDMAKEMMNNVKSGVLYEAATTMLAQANQSPQSVMQLLQDVA